MSWENLYPLVNVYITNWKITFSWENQLFRLVHFNSFVTNYQRVYMLLATYSELGCTPAYVQTNKKTYKSNVSPQRCKPICNISLGASDLFWLQHVFLDVYRILLIICPVFSRWIVHCSSLSPCKAPDYILIIPFVDDHIPLNPIKSHEHYHSPHC